MERIVKLAAKFANTKISNLVKFNDSINRNSNNTFENILIAALVAKEENDIHPDVIIEEIMSRIENGDSPAVLLITCASLSAMLMKVIIQDDYMPILGMFSSLITIINKKIVHDYCLLFITFAILSHKMDADRCISYYHNLCIDVFEMCPIRLTNGCEFASCIEDYINDANATSKLEDVYIEQFSKIIARWVGDDN